MRIGQRGTQTRLWARKGTRPRVVRQQQSESAYIFGAVCPQQGSAVGLVMPQANTEAMAHHLQALSEAVPAGRHAVLVLDRAGWHTTPKLPQFPNVSLLPLPAGSQAHPSSTRPSRYGSNCATGTWPTAATTVMSK